MKKSYALSFWRWDIPSKKKNLIDMKKERKNRNFSSYYISSSLSSHFINRRKRVFIKGAFFSLFLIALIGLEQILWYKATDNFRIAKIEYPLPVSSEKEIFSSQAEKENIDLILQKTFSYLGKGHHAYAFASDDGKYVIKFPRFHKFRTPFWGSWSYILPKKVKTNLEKDKERLDFIWKSHEIAASTLKEETGLLFLHLKKTTSLPNRISLIDKLGRKHQIDPNRFGFILQKKFPLVENIIPKLIQNKDLASIREVLASLFELKAKRAKKLVMNKDRHGIGRNHGYANEQVYEIDIGSYLINENFSMIKEIEKEVLFCTNDLRNLLQRSLENGEKLFDEEFNNWKRAQ